MNLIYTSGKIYVYIPRIAFLTCPEVDGGVSRVKRLLTHFDKYPFFIFSMCFDDVHEQ